MRWPAALVVWLFGVSVSAVTLGAACATQRASAPPYVIGFSQATTNEPWRLIFNKELRAEAAEHEEVELLVSDGKDDADQQIADMEAFMAQGVDALLISPKVAEALTPVVNKACKAGFPVIVLDRDLINDGYDQFIGGDNLLIGRTAGKYAASLLGGTGQARGRIVEIGGGMASTPAQDRHSGFREAISDEPGIEVLNEPEDGDWKQDRGYEIMASALAAFPQIDLVFAHNDPMAFGAYLAAKDVGREREMFILGIDGIPAEGIRWVHEGILTATFIYDRPGKEAIRQVLKLLRGQPIEKRIMLPTAIVTSRNAGAHLDAAGITP